MRKEDIASSVREAFEEGRYEATRHFWDELRADDFLLADLHTAFGSIQGTKEMGDDLAGNPKYEVTGLSADGRPLSVVCSVKETGVFLFVTVYEGSS